MHHQSELTPILPFLVFALLAVVATLRRGVVRRKTIGREGVSLELTSFQIVFAERERKREEEMFACVHTKRS